MAGTGVGRKSAYKAETLAHSEMSSFFAQTAHFSILILLLLAILDCTCRAASHFRFDEASGFIFAVRESLSTSVPHIYRVASLSLSIDFRADL
jgi:hypothetical protein